jgi:hypothetical protein
VSFLFLLLALLFIAGIGAAALYAADDDPCSEEASGT